MATTRDSNGIFLLKDNQLGTLKNLGKICGERLRKASQLCGEDPHLLSLMLLGRFCNKFSRLEKEKKRLHESLDKKWRKENQGKFFAPRMLVEQAIELYVQRYAHSVLGSLKNFLSGKFAGKLLNNELGDDKILVQLVLYSANAEQSSFGKINIHGSGAWLRLCRILREEKRRAMREGNLAVARDKAMSFLASVFLAQLLSTYRVEPNTAFLDFAISIYDTVVSAS